MTATTEKRYTDLMAFVRACIAHECIMCATEDHIIAYTNDAVGCNPNNWDNYEIGMFDLIENKGFLLIKNEG